MDQRREQIGALRRLSRLERIVFARQWSHGGPRSLGQSPRTGSIGRRWMAAAPHLAQRVRSMPQRLESMATQSAQGLVASSAGGSP